MKKFFILFFALLSFLKAEPSLDELADFTPMFAIRSLETGISLSPFRKTSKRLEDQNWFLKEIVANDELKARDMHAKDLPFGYVQFISPRGDDICLAVLSEKSFGTKSCKQDLQDGTMQTIFSIIPMTNGSIQIRSLTNGGNQCMSTFPDSSIAIENRFGLGECLLDRSIVTVLSKLFFFSPAIIEASAIY